MHRVPTRETLALSAFEEEESAQEFPSVSSDKDVLDVDSTFSGYNNNDDTVPSSPPVSLVYVPNNYSGREALRDQGYWYDKVTTHNKKCYVRGPPPRIGHWDDDTIESVSSDKENGDENVGRCAEPTSSDKPMVLEEVQVQQQYQEE